MNPLNPNQNFGPKKTFRPKFRTEISDYSTEIPKANSKKLFGRNFGRISVSPKFRFREKRSQAASCLVALLVSLILL